MNTGEGGLHADLEPYQDNIIVQCASGRFGVDSSYLQAGAAVEIKIGQGAKPGIGGHLPGEKIDYEVSITRMIPQGTDALSPAPHHDIYSIEDLRQLIYALKEATGYKPISVKIACVHNIAAIASGVVRAGADIVYLDGFRGGYGRFSHHHPRPRGHAHRDRHSHRRPTPARRGHPQPGFARRRRRHPQFGRRGQGHRPGCRRLRHRHRGPGGPGLPRLPEVPHRRLLLGHLHPEARA